MSNQKPDGWAIYKHGVLLRVCLAFGMAQEIAYCSKEQKDFSTSEEWYIYRDSAIRDATDSPTNEYEIKPVWLSSAPPVPVELVEWARDMRRFMNHYLSAGYSAGSDKVNVQMRAGIERLNKILPEKETKDEPEKA